MFALIIKDKRHVAMHTQGYPKHCLLTLLFIDFVCVDSGLLGTLYPIFNQLAGKDSEWGLSISSILTRGVVVIGFDVLIGVKVNHWQIELVLCVCWSYFYFVSPGILVVASCLD